MYSQQYLPSAPINPYPMDSDERLRKFEYLVNRYEINREFATRLRALEGYEIVFIVDGKSNEWVLYLSCSNCHFLIEYKREENG